MFVCVCVVAHSRCSLLLLQVCVHDQWYYDLVNQKLVEEALEDEGVTANFDSGVWTLDWSQAKPQ